VVGITQPEVLRLALATAAFLVAVLTLYLGTLKRAEISLIFLSDRGVWVRQQQRRPEVPPE